MDLFARWRSKTGNELAVSAVTSLEHGDPKQRLLDAAIQVFAAKGYDSASTREICRHAGANVAAIHYYFGDKASLYRAIFRLPEQFTRFPDELADARLPLRDALVVMYRQLMSFMSSPMQAQQLRMMFLREQLNPTGVLDNQIETLRSQHEQWIGFLRRRLGVAHADVGLVHLAVSLFGLAMVLFVQRTEIQTLAPELLSGRSSEFDESAALEATVQRLANHGVALIEAEAVRREQP